MARSGKEQRSAGEVGDVLPRVKPVPLVAPPGFVDDARAVGVEFDPGDLEKLGSYLALLIQANETMNLTAVTEPAAMWRRHILDSLTVLQTLADLPERARVIDVGSGGGLPGIPLAVCLPGLRFTLLEATAKKAAFLTRVAELLDLKNVRVVNARAERAAHDRGTPLSRRDAAAAGEVAGHREAYDVVIARAVGRLSVLLELTAGFCRIGGRMSLIKGEKAPEEVAEAKGAFHQLKVAYVDTLETPTGRIVVVEKLSATPRLFPRADGEPSRSPLV